MNRTTKMLAMLIAAVTLAAGWLAAGVARAEEEQYLVVAAGNTFPESRVQDVKDAGGKIVKVFPQIGLAVATSADPDFPAKAEAIVGVASVVPDPLRTTSAASVGCHHQQCRQIHGSSSSVNV